MPNDSELERQLLAAIPTDGEGVGNTRLMCKLGWDESLYWEVRNRLVDQGVLQLGRGRGGSVRRVVAPKLAHTVALSHSAKDAQQVDGEERIKEQTLYGPIAKVLEEHWVRDRRFESSIVQVTALQGRRLTGGKWSRPDVAVATLSTYPYVPGRHFDVVTFEIKPADALDVTAVYEALAHLRSATRAYVVAHVPDSEREALQEEVDEVALVAKTHGVGLIVLADPSDYNTWEDLAEAERTEPDPRRLNDFLATQFTPEQREKLVKWFR